MVNFSAIDLSPLLRPLSLPVKYDISSQRKGLGAKHVHLARCDRPQSQYGVALPSLVFSGLQLVGSAAVLQCEFHGQTGIS